MRSVVIVAPWRPQQRAYGYPEYEGGPERRLWDVVDARGVPVFLGSIYGDSETHARLAAKAPLLPELAEALRLTLGECPCDGDCRSCRRTVSLLARYDEEPGT